MNLKTVFASVGLLGLTALAAEAGPASQPDVAQPLPSVQEKAWEFKLVPYLWAAGLKGYTGQAPNVGYVDLGFSDLADHLDFAMSGTFAAMHRSGWGFVFDGQWIELAGDTPFPAPAYTAASVDITSAFGMLAPTYRLVDTETLNLHLYAGARVTYSETEMTFLGGIGPVPPSVGVLVDDTWIDGVIGLQYQWDFADKWFIGGLIDVGAGDSDLNWQALVGLGYRINDCWSVQLGYRYMKVDYEDSGFVYDIETQGLALGVGYRW